MIELRSYRRVFELERRIYRIDRLRLNPAGVPVRGIVYFLVLVAASVLAGAFPPTAMLVSAMPWYLRALVLPGLGAALLALIRLEGRPFHLASVGTRWLPPDILLLPDGSDARIRRLRYSGPGAALVTVEHERVEGGAALPWTDLWRRRQRGLLTVRELAGRHPPAQGQVVTLARGARLATLGSPTRARRRSRWPVGRSTPTEPSRSFDR